MNELIIFLQSPELFPMLGLTVLGGILFYLTLLILGQVRLSLGLEGLRQKELSVLVERSERLLAAAKMEELDEYGAWQGTRKFEIRKKVLEVDSIRSFYLVPHDGKPLPAFRPGQFLTFNLKIPGTPSENTIRCYSLSDAPTHPEYYRVSIKQLGPPPKKPDAPPGLSSNHFHKDLQENDILDVMAPSGDFFLDTHTDTPVILIGGGIGLTPVISMLNYIANTKSNRETWFFYGLRNGTEHVWRYHLNKMRNYPNITIVVCYSDPNEADIEGKDYDVKGRVGVALFKEKLNSNNYDFYICGPPPMMSAVVNDLDEWGVPEENVHFEAFGPASIRKKGTQEESTTPTESIEIEFARTGKKAVWDGSHKNLWDFATAQGVAIQKGCGVGNCGTCKTALRTGEVNYKKKPAFRYEKGSCLVCCATPDGPVTLDA